MSENSLLVVSNITTYPYTLKSGVLYNFVYNFVANVAVALFCYQCLQS
jgi:hypothetical protein